MKQKTGKCMKKGNLKSSSTFLILRGKFHICLKCSADVETK